MNPEYAAELLKTMIFQAVTLASPFLLTAMAFGMAISLFQAVTTINEPTLAFVPKALALAVTMVLLGPYMLSSLRDFTRVLFDRLVMAGGS